MENLLVARGLWVIRDLFDAISEDLCCVGGDLCYLYYCLSLKFIVFKFFLSNHQQNILVIVQFVPSPFVFFRIWGLFH